MQKLVKKVMPLAVVVMAAIGAAGYYLLNGAANAAPSGVG